MHDFSIEMAAERIPDARTRDYFGEVFVSYTTGNFRSATVMLWSVVICDLLFKLEELQTTYADETATALLEEVESKRANNPKSPQWELWLVDEVQNRTKLIEGHEYEALASLQMHRHMSAHPVLDQRYHLHKPTLEAVRADIRAALDGVLTKPALMTKGIFKALVEDLESRIDQFPNDDDLKRYLDAKFFKQLVPAVSKEVFKSLWCVVFISTDPQCVKNRLINFRALKILLEKNPAELMKLTDSEKERLSHVSSDPDALKSLTYLLCERPAIFKLLSDVARVPLKEFVEKNCPELGWFIREGGVREHVEVLTYISPRATKMDFGLLSEVAMREGLGPKLAELVVRTYISSGTYNGADRNYQVLSWITHLLTPELLTECLSGIESNQQTFGRRRAREDHTDLKKICDQQLGLGFDYTPYPNFTRSLSSI
jgi:hypothetical protein